MTTFVKKGMFVLVGVAGLVVLGPGSAWAQAAAPAPGSPGGGNASGGPGTLGTEVPIDSAVAEGYVHARSRVRGESDRQLVDGIRQLLSENRRAMEQAQRATSSSDPTIADAAKEVADARSIAEFNLLRAAQESGFDLGEQAEGGFAATGSMGESADLPSYGISGDTVASAPASSETGTSADTSTSPEESFGSTASSDMDQHSTAVGDLLRDARDANRLQLASSLEIAQKALNNASRAMAALPSSTGSSTPSSTP